jgi:peroxiredoxin Q/BCP
MKLAILGIVAGLFAMAVSYSSAHAEPLKKGETAPDFELVGSDGKTYQLSELTKDKVVVIAWFPKAFTGGCTKECQSLRENGKAIREFDVAYFAASVDPAEKNKEFAESLELDYPILSDPQAETAKQLGIYNEDRKIANRVTFYIGEDNKILLVDDKVKVDEHGADVAKQLKELGVPKAETSE